MTLSYFFYHVTSYYEVSQERLSQIYSVQARIHRDGKRRSYNSGSTIRGLRTIKAQGLQDCRSLKPTFCDNARFNWLDLSSLFKLVVIHKKWHSPPLISLYRYRYIPRYAPRNIDHRFSSSETPIWVSGALACPGNKTRTKNICWPLLAEAAIRISR